MRQQHLQDQPGRLGSLDRPHGRDRPVLVIRRDPDRVRRPRQRRLRRGCGRQQPRASWCRCHFDPADVLVQRRPRCVHEGRRHPHDLLGHERRRDERHEQRAARCRSAVLTRRYAHRLRRARRQRLRHLDDSGGRRCRRARHDRRRRRTRADVLAERRDDRLHLRRRAFLRHRDRRRHAAGPRRRRHVAVLLSRRHEDRIRQRRRPPRGNGRVDRRDAHADRQHRGCACRLAVDRLFSGPPERQLSDDRPCFGRLVTDRRALPGLERGLVGRLVPDLVQVPVEAVRRGRPGERHLRRHRRAPRPASTRRSQPMSAVACGFR